MMLKRPILQRQQPRGEHEHEHRAGGDREAGEERPVGEVAHTQAGARREHPGPAVGRGLHREDLVDAHAPFVERDDAADHVEPPDPRHLHTDEVDDLVPARLERGQPRACGAHVVLAQRLHVTDLEPGILDQGDGLTDRPHVHVGRNVRLDERPAAGRGTARVTSAGRGTRPSGRSRCASVSVNIG